MRYLAVLCLSLGGCFVVFPIPSSSEPGNACVGEYASIGQRVGPNTGGANYGKYAIVKKVYGRSERCTDPKRPMIADVLYED
jgi:hypothetical protein